MAVKIDPVKRVLAVADSQIGYSRWTDKQRGTKYARETQPIFWPRDFWLLTNGINFCDIGVTWVFWKALGEDFVLNSLPGGASYNTDYRASKGGRIPKSFGTAGDIAVFDWNLRTLSTNHVGIIEKRLRSGNFQTIEFNTSPGDSGSQSSGGGVYRRVRRPDQIRYILRPQWNEYKPSVKSSGVAAKAAAKKPTAKPTAKKTAPKAPAFPLPRRKDAMFYYGPADGPKESVSGKGPNDAVRSDVVKVNNRWTSKGLAKFQQQLINRGWSELEKNGGADGRFGDTTEKVVGQFQKAMGIKQDKKVGPETWRLAWEAPIK